MFQCKKHHSCFIGCRFDDCQQKLNKSAAVFHYIYWTAYNRTKLQWFICHAWVVPAAIVCIWFSFGSTKAKDFLISAVSSIKEYRFLSLCISVGSFQLTFQQALLGKRLFQRPQKFLIKKAEGTIHRVIVSPAKRKISRPYDSHILS